MRSGRVSLLNIVEAVGSGSRMIRRVEIDPPGFMKVISPMTKMMVVKANLGFLTNLKRILEK